MRLPRDVSGSEIVKALRVFGYARELSDHNVKTVPQMGWAGKARDRIHPHQLAANNLLKRFPVRRPPHPNRRPAKPNPFRGINTENIVKRNEFVLAKASDRKDDRRGC